MKRRFCTKQFQRILFWKWVLHEKSSVKLVNERFHDLFLSRFCYYMPEKLPNSFLTSSLKLMSLFWINVEVMNFFSLIQTIQKFVEFSSNLGQINLGFKDLQYCFDSPQSFIQYVHKIFRKTNISYPLKRWRACAYLIVRKVNFIGKFC